MARILSGNALFFLCDVQTRFKTAIYGFEEVVSTANKMIKIAKILGCEVIATEQNPAALGSTVPDLSTLGPLHLGTFSKTRFSMVTQEVSNLLLTRGPAHPVVLFGIESHVCVLQTCLDLLDLGYQVHVLADGVSSCNKEEIPFALSRISQAGGIVTTSESVAFQLLRDASKPNFKEFSALIKQEKAATKKAVEVLMQHRSSL